MNIFLDAKTPEDSIYMAQTSNTAMQSKVECRLTCNNCNAIVYATGMGRYGNHVVLFNTGEAGLEISDDEEDLDIRFALALSKTETLTAVTNNQHTPAANFCNGNSTFDALLPGPQSVDVDCEVNANFLRILMKKLALT